ncbi:MAG: hypothetical protein IJX71_05565, partial [Oscillospiraceae bacterium]|nr:hypothetical protein [Oscillospiraceae bacterium]
VCRLKRIFARHMSVQKMSFDLILSFGQNSARLFEPAVSRPRFGGGIFPFTNAHPFLFLSVRFFHSFHFVTSH